MLFTCHLHKFGAVQPVSTAVQEAAYIHAEYARKATFLRLPQQVGLSWGHRQIDYIQGLSNQCEMLPGA